LIMGKNPCNFLSALLIYRRKKKTGVHRLTWRILSSVPHPVHPLKRPNNNSILGIVM